jgi:hypothetical protein
VGPLRWDHQKGEHLGFMIYDLGSVGHRDGSLLGSRIVDPEVGLSFWRPLIFR